MIPDEPKPAHGSGPGFTWELLAPAFVIFLLLFLAALWASHQIVLDQARALDLARAQRSVYAAKTTLEGGLDSGSAEEILTQLQQEGLKNLQLLPPDVTAPEPNPRYITPGSYAEAWAEVQGPDGQTIGLLHLAQVRDAGQLALSLVRQAAVVLFFILGAVFIVLWLTLDRRVTRPLQKLSRTLLRPPAAISPAAVTGHPLKDLTAAVQVQQQRAAEAEAARQSLLDNHSEMASRCTPDGILLEVNEAYCRTFGRTHDELEGRNYFDLIPPADRIEAVLNLRRLSRRHPESTLDHRIVLPNGEVRWTRWRDCAVFDQDGRVREVLSFGLDVTAEKAMASRVAELQTAFDQMQSLAHTGSLTWDFQSDEMEWTEETARLLGRASEFKTPTLDTLLDLVAPEDRPGLQHCFTLARETGSPFEHEFRVILPDGSFRVLQSRAEVGADPQTKLLNQLTCALRDITVLREAESALRRELRRREAVEQSLAAGHVIHDETGRIISVNRAFCHMTGWSAGELIGRQPPFPYWPAEDADKIAEAFSNTMAGHTPAEGFQFRFRRKDDSRLDVLIRVAPLLDDHDQRLGWLGAITDVTTLQETRRRLHEANERLEVARDIAAFGTWAWNPESGEIIWDRTSFALFGHPDATDAVSVWRAVRPASETARAEQNVLQAEAAGRNAGRFLIHILWPDGSEHSVESSFRRVPRTGTAAVRFIGVHRDITEELARERELRAANERLQIATSVAGFGIWEWNPATDKLTWDRVSFATFGQPEATDANRVWCESLPEEERHRLTAKLQRLIDEGATAGRDLLFITTPTGEQRRVLSTYRLLRDEQGRLQTILGVNSDRTNDPEPDAALTPDFQA